MLQEQAVEARRVLDLRPVPAFAEHMQLRTRNTREQIVGVLQRDHAVLAPVHDQGVVGQGAIACCRSW
jgi:hypothetical protein